MLFIASWPRKLKGCLGEGVRVRQRQRDRWIDRDRWMDRDGWTETERHADGQRDGWMARQTEG